MSRRYGMVTSGIGVGDGASYEVGMMCLPLHTFGEASAA